MTDIPLRESLTLRHGSGPLYLQAADNLARLIETGALRPGDRLPSERDLTELSGLSRVTIRKALSTLAAREMIEQRQGSGTYVTGPRMKAAQPCPPVTSLTDQFLKRGQPSRTIWLSRQIVLASFHHMTVLGLPAPDRVAQLERLRMVNEHPLSIERSVFRVTALPEVETLGQSINAVLHDLGTLPVRVVQEVSAVNMSPKDADCLGALPAAAALQVTRTGYNDEGAIIEHTRGVFRPDAYQIITEFGG